MWAYCVTVPVSVPVVGTKFSVLLSKERLLMIDFASTNLLRHIFEEKLTSHNVSTTSFYTSACDIIRIIMSCSSSLP